MATPILIEPDRGLIRDVMEAGGADVKKCFQCATCTSVCSLSTADHAFPRKQMLMAQWGLKEQLTGDPGPWLCFYCGECSKTCPREANPGETMMAIRRYLTACYDWTGLSRLMYRSAIWEIGVLAVAAAIVVLFFTVPANFGFGLLRQSPVALSTVMLDQFAPKLVVHHADQVLAVLLSICLLLNAGRMFRALTRGDNIPLRFYLAQIPAVIVEAVTQKRWRNCGGDGSQNWLRHFLLVTGYATIFGLVLLFLPWFQIEDSSFHWTSIPGYYSTVVLLGTTVWIILDRVNRKTEMHRFSELSDWLFPILLFLTGLTGILLHLFRLLNQPMPTYVTYTVHLAVAVPMLVVEVPFGKWAHLLYRPVAIYVASVKSAALKEGLVSVEAQPAGAGVGR